MPASSAPGSLIRDLIRISRFDRYNSFLAVFSGVWATLIAGASRLKEDPSSTSASFVFKQTILCFLHCYIFSGAGMVWNDWIDRDIDVNVARTKNRPLASGRLRVTDAMLWMLFQFLVSAALLQQMMGGQLLFFTLIPQTICTIIYPFGKRPAVKKLGIYPQYLLGLAAACPAVSGWASIYGDERSIEFIFAQSRPLCFYAFFWIFFFNTAYSYQDIRDDSKMNINSFYVLVGKHIHACLVILGGLVLSTIAWTISPLESPWLWFSWFGVWTASYMEQLVKFDPTKPETGGTVHKKNCALGLWAICACVIEVVLKI